jgi:hypothetical protein
MLVWSDWPACAAAHQPRVGSGNEGQRFDALNLRRREGKQDGTGESTPADQHRRQYQSRGMADHAVSVDLALDREALKEACEFAREAEQQANAAKNLWSKALEFPHRP